MQHATDSTMDSKLPSVRAQSWGLVVVGLGLLDIAIWFIVLTWFYTDKMTTSEMLITITTTMLTFGMGASTQALFARVGGGIYTKAADVGGRPRR